MNRIRRNLTGALLAAPIATLTTAPRITFAQAHKYRFAFSQVTTLEPWRVQFNKDMKAEAARHPEIDFVIADANDRTDKQNADVENFISQKVDVIFISPKESSGLTGVVAKAYKMGIPVFVLDRPVNGDQFTQFVGGDNVLIGKGAGQFIVETLGGAGKAKGQIVEVWGGFGAQGAHDRHDGMFSLVGKEAGLKIVGRRIDCDWKQDKAYEYMRTVLRVNPQVDLVFAHNDPMAYGAYLAAKDMGLEKKMRFVGADGLPNEGAAWVDKGILTATFVYPTPGAEAIRQALKLLAGGKLEKQVVLPTQAITASNAKQFVAA